MPETKSIPKADAKKPDAPQKGDAPQTPPAPTSKTSSPPKMPESNAAPSVGAKKPVEQAKAPAAKTAPAAGEKKPADKPKVEPDAAEKKSGEKLNAPAPKAVPATGEKKPTEKSTIPDTKAASSAVQKNMDDKAPTIAPEAGSKKTPVNPSPSMETSSAQNNKAKKSTDDKAAPDKKPIEPPKSVPASETKAAPTEKPGHAAEGPKGIVITQVFDDRLAPPGEAELKNLPIPKEGEAFSLRLHPAYFYEFLEHPFSINRETKDYKDLYESIKENGIHDPVYCRPRANGGLEIMSGHRRHDIGAQLNYPIPTIIVQADDDTARIAVVDGNLHRMDIPTSELARAAKMKMEALSRKAGRRSKMDQLAAPQKRSDQQVAEDMGMSRNQVQRLVRIDSLVPELKQQVDNKKLPFNTAVELSYMTPAEQKIVVDFMEKEQVTPSMAQATELKEASKHAETLAKYTPSLAPAHKVDEKKIESIMKPKQEPELKVTLKGSELKPYFPDKLPPAHEIKQTILDALSLRKKVLEKQAKKLESKPPAR